MTNRNSYISGIGCAPDDKLVVQKSNPMTVLSRSDMSLAELKILDMYLARIDTHKPEHNTVKLTKGQLEKALGITQIKKSDLKQRLKRLYQPIDLAKDDQNRLHLITLFEEASAEQDEDGIWQITLTCTQSAMKYMFCIEEYGYFKYKLSSVVSLKSRYSVILFLYLEKNRFRISWEESVPVLKHELNCDNDELYSEFKMFNQRILKRCQTEILEKTDCKFTYVTVKKGRKVVAVRFTLQSSLSDAGEINPKILDQLQISDPDDPVNFLGGAVTPFGSDQPEFNRTELEQLFQALVGLPDNKLPCNSDGLEFRRYHYLAERYAALNRQHSKRPIKHRFAYLLKLIKADSIV